MPEWVTWAGIVICLSQSGLFSGLNLAVFSISRLRLEAAAAAGESAAARVLALRRNANFTLATVLWGNVAANVLLAILADSVMTGAVAFLFSTVLITFCGEVLPQAFFARHAFRMVGLLRPLLRFYQIALYPVARPTGWMLNKLVGPEGVPWFTERELRRVLRHQAQVGGTEIDSVEATGAINFLALDDLPVGEEGEVLDPRSLLPLAFADGQPVWPAFQRRAEDPFLQRLNESGKKWVVITDEQGEPRFVLNAYNFLRNAILGGEPFDPLAYCHRPLVVRENQHPLGRVLNRLTVRPEHAEDDVVDKDIILVWSNPKRIITGSDILGRLLRGIVSRESP
jgi:hypothetical protein